MALWTLAEQQQFKPIDQNNIGRFAQLQNEVEINDIVKYLGFEFYQELKRNPSTYATFLNGGSYDYAGYSYTFEGFKKCCAYLLYARYVRSSYIQDTFSGFMMHTADNMQKISAGELANQEARNMEIAGTIWDQCFRYLQTLSLPWFPIKSKTKRIEAL